MVKYRFFFSFYMVKWHFSGMPILNNSSIEKWAKSAHLLLLLAQLNDLWLLSSLVENQTMRKHQQALHCGGEFSPFSSGKDAGAVELSLGSGSERSTGCCPGRAAAAGAARLGDADPSGSARVLLWALAKQKPAQHDDKELFDLAGLCLLGKAFFAEFRAVLLLHKTN